MSDGGPATVDGSSAAGDTAPGPPPAPPVAAGRVTLHRLNRAEYNNTVRDLLGAWLRPADEFPADDSGYGFDNIADVLSLSPLQVEMYERAAEALVTEALRVYQPLNVQLEAEIIGGSVGQAVPKAWLLWSNGEVAAPVKIPAPGRYKISIRAWEAHAGAESAKLTLRIDGTDVQSFDVTAPANAPATYETSVELKGGTPIVAAAFVNDLFDRATNLDRNLYVDHVKVEGPLGGAPMNAARARLLGCDPAAAGNSEVSCAQQLLGRFARLAWRRPVTAEELASLVALVELARKEGDDFATGMALAFESILLSPHFLFRVESEAPGGGPRWLDDHELATRLAYFLWSSTPDVDLLDAADARQLTAGPEKRQAQVARLLADPRSAAFVDNFAGQWLETRRLGQHEVDYNAFPSFDPALRAAMARESQLFFQEFLRQPLDARRLLDADFTFINDRLARHYGLPAVSGPAFERVSSVGTTRRGVLGQAAVLTVTSYQTRTSPVRRGKWVMDQLMCSPPPPPPPGVEGLAPPIGPATTLRQRLERHRSEPLCASCHALMDPLGFGLESFDGIGAHRHNDQGLPIDEAGQLPDGRRFTGAVELAGVLATDPRFPACLAEKLFVYALGRGAQPSDLPHLEAIGKTFADSGYRLPALITAVVESVPFRARGEDPGTSEVKP